MEVVREPAPVRHGQSAYRGRADLGQPLRGVLKRFLAHAAQRVGPGMAISTRRVAMSAHHLFDDLVAALRVGVGLRRALGRGLLYLLTNARRSNPDRHRRKGRLRVGLLITQAA